MKKLILKALIFFVCIIGVQYSSFCQFYLINFTGSATCPTPGNVPVMAQNSTGTGLTRSTMNCSAISSVFGSTNANITANVLNTSYIEFSATAASGFQLNVTSLSFFRQGSGTAPAQLEVRYSTDGFATSNAWGSAPNTPSTGSVATWDFTDFSTGNGGTVTFRIYNFGTVSVNGGTSQTGGTFRLDDVTINGTVSSVVPPTPTTTSIIPSAVVAGSSTFTLTVNGSNFISGSSTVRLNGSAKTTTFVSSAQLTAIIPSSDIVSAGTASIDVLTTGAPASNAQTLTINAPAAPTKFAITSISPSSPIQGNTFNVTVQSLDGNDVAQNVSQSTGFVLSNTGGGSIGGTTTGTIANGTNSVVVTGVTLSAAGSGVTLTATGTSGDNLTAGTSSPFTVLATATQLAFVGVPSSGSIGANLSSFTVEARRPDNSLDVNYTGTITVSKASGPGTLSGTASVAAVAGIATFNNIQFDQVGAYTLNADASGLTTATSSTITIQSHVVISQVYGGGGNSGSVYKNDFIELYNPTSSTVSLNGWSVQYTSATGTSWTAQTNLSGSIAPGHYYLIQEAVGTGGTTNLPTPDVIGTIAMGASAFKVALVSNTTPLTGGCPTGGAIVDFVGAGATASCFEGSSFAPAPSNTNAIFRANNGCTETNQNSTDFSSGLAAPRNSASPFWSCTCNTPTAFAVTGGGAYCTGESGVTVGLSGSEVGNSYQLYLNSSPDGSPVTGNGNAISFGTKTAAGTYSVVATYPAANCTAAMTGSVTISINPLPTISISGASSICDGSSTTLTASGASTYSWSNGYNTASSSVSPSTNTTYSVTGTDANGCVNSASQLVTINSLPTVSISGTNTICSGNSTTLTANGANTYVWSSGPSTANYAVSPSSNTTYTVTGTDANGCANTASQMVTVNSSPEISITGATTIIIGGSTTLIANGADTYLWNTAATTASIIVSPTITTTYSVTGTSSAGCVGQSSVTVTVNEGSSAVALTEVKSVHCGTTLASKSTQIFINSVSGATNYEYELTESGTGNVYLYQRGMNNNGFMFSYVPQTQHGRTYSIRVRAFVGGWGNFGSSCDVSLSATIPSTQIQSSYCGTTLASKSTQILCNVVGGATNYEYELTESGTGNVYFYQRGLGNTGFMFSYVPQTQYGRTYSIRVRAFVGSWGNFGTACSVSMPLSAPRYMDPSIVLSDDVITEFDQATLNVFPNPSTGNIKLETNRVGTYYIINELGQVVRTIEITDVSTPESVEGLAAGMYTVISNQAAGFIRQKIVVTE